MIIASLLMLFLQNDAGIIRERIESDYNLVVPGKGAEGVCLSCAKAQVKKVYKKASYRVSKVRKTKDLFKDVFKIDSPVSITFDTAYYYKDKKVVIFFLNNIVRAVSSMRNDRITSDSIDLRRGTGFFIFHYGNEMMIKRKSKNNVVYLYPKKGIAIADDDNNDEIDVFVVFPPKK